jgi:hypothetical protein
MGYGIKPPGYWGGKNVLTWRQVEGAPHQHLAVALGCWQTAVGITFEEGANPGVNVDFKVKSEISTESTSWSPSIRTLALNRSHSLGIVLHEIGHLLGLSHEQDHPDGRKAYYTGTPGSFGFAESMRIAESRTNLQKYGNYDPASIMHYPDTTYALMTRPSAGDIAAVKLINGWP